MKILVTGATGFVGGNVCDLLVKLGHAVTVLSRRADADRREGVRAVEGDVVTGAGLDGAVAGVDAVIHLVGIIRERARVTFDAVHVEGTRNVLAAAHAAGVKRFLHMSALGADPESRSGYHRSKGRAEELVRGSDSEWTILRPSLNFGAGDAFFGETLRGLVEKPPVIPVVGRGDQPLRPIWVRDVATAFARALERPATAGRSFDLVGLREYTLRELLLLVRGALGSRKPLLEVPLPIMRLGVALFRLLPNPPITRDEFLMLQAGNTGDPRPAVEAFGLELAELEDHLSEVLGTAAPAPRQAQPAA